jgi:hypothetical protein
MAKTVEKRSPTLADLFITHAENRKVMPDTGSMSGMEQFTKTAKRKVQLAEKFVFDREASERVGTVLRDVPELLVEQIQFARPPFDLCWIEYDADIILEILNPGRNDIYDKTRDKRVGILIEHNRIVVLAESWRGTLSFIPFVYYLNTEWLLRDQLDFCDVLKISRLGIDMWLWGSAANKFMKEGKTDYLRVLRDSNMVQLLRREKYTKELSFETANKVMSATTGDFKNHVAMLLMLNRPALTQYIRIPQTRGWIGSKPRPFMSHNTIRMALDPVPKIRMMSEGGEGSGSLRRRHRVRGHYCHNEAARKAIIHHTCIHDWQPADNQWKPIKAEIGDDIERWVCASGCKGKRWWREEHRRGHYSEGEIEHTYEVTRYEKAPS